MKNKERQRIQVVDTTDGWFDGKTIIPFSKLSDKRLQNAKLHAQRKELIYHNKYCIFAELVANLDDEAARRGITLKDYNTEFHKNQRKLKEKTINNEV